MKIVLALIISIISFIFLPNKIVFATDTTPPISTLTIDPVSSTGSNGWYNQSVDIQINASDNDSGVAKISYTLDSHPQVDKDIQASPNLIDNPSFEEHHNYIPYYWDRPIFSSNVYVSPNYSVDGLYSLRFNYNIWPINYLTNESYYISADSFETYFFSAWLKTNVVGFGINYEIMAKINGSDQLIYRSPSYNNLSDFTFVNKSFTTPSGTTALYINLYSIGWGNAYFDSLYLGKITAESSVNFNISEQGKHTLIYYATDQADNVGDNNDEEFNIDITAPSNWQNFNYTEQGNSHTLVLTIDVSDSISGLNLTNAFFQYYIEGVGWGVYEDLTNCSSSFLLNQWAVPTVSYVVNPTKAKITTPKIDFCNSNWAQDKKIHFKIMDIAGNESISPEYALNSPWIYTSKFDVGSNNAISFTAVSQADGVVEANGDITNLDTTSGITLKDYVNSTEISALSLISQTDFITLPENKLPTENGRYRFVGNMTLDNKSINNYDKNTICSVVAIDGSLTISKDYSLKDSSSCLIFLIIGNVTLAQSVNNIEGFFIVDGTFNTGSSNKSLTVKGGVVANNITLSRSLSGKENLTDPSEYFDYDLNLLFNAAELLSTSRNSTFWLEL